MVLTATVDQLVVQVLQAILTHLVLVAYQQTIHTILQQLQEVVAKLIITFNHTL
jgi:hypothetical protein